MSDIFLPLGYGHMTPDTWVGQLLTVFYGLVGLPISMLALKTLGEVIVSGIQSLVARIEKRLLKKRDVRKIRQKTFLGTCVLMILFLLLGSVINVLAEGWSFVEGIYVWFVVLSTIGFGDYIPFQSLDQKSENGREILWVFITILAFFVLLGLCVVSAVLTSLVQAAEEFKSKTKPAGKLVQFFKRQKIKVLRSSVYETNEEMVDEEKGPSNEVVLLEINSRVRSNSI